MCYGMVLTGSLVLGDAIHAGERTIKELNTEGGSRDLPGGGRSAFMQALRFEAQGEYIKAEERLNAAVIKEDAHA